MFEYRQPTGRTGARKIRVNGSLRAIATTDRKLITLADVRRAEEHIRGKVSLTPTYKLMALSRYLGLEVIAKLENIQDTRAYKVRGAFSFFAENGPEARARGVVGASAGNHAQAIAWAGSKCGAKVTVYMPNGTPAVKVKNTIRYGARVVQVGDTYDEACEAALEDAKINGKIFAHPFADPAVIAGQGTIGLELDKQVPGLGTVVVPVGGGGLLSGIGTAIKGLRPSVDVVGVEPWVLPSMTDALLAGGPPSEPLPPRVTLADGAAVRRVDALTHAHCAALVDQMVTVTEESIGAAIRLLAKDGIWAEGAGALSVAALLQKAAELSDPTVVIISGGNIDADLHHRLTQMNEVIPAK